MEILSINADQKIVNIASTIGKHQSSWGGWHALMIEMDDISDDLYKDCLVWTRMIVESYLQSVTGRMYFCESKSIHILCKTNTPRILHQVGEQVMDMMEAENEFSCTYNVYNLKEDGHMYTQNILDRANIHYSLNLSNMKPNRDIFLEEVQKKQRICKSIKILLVEDDVVTRWMVRSAVKDECDLFTASTAHKVYNLYINNKPDIVFLDINLPDANGLSVLEWIVKNDPGACVIMFSGDDSLDNISNALENGAKGFIKKPFLKDDIYYYIRNFYGVN